MSDHWLAERIMASQTVREAQVSEAQVVAVLRALADFTLWQRAFDDRSVDGPALHAARHCHAIADDILDRKWAMTDKRELMDDVVHRAEPPSLRDEIAALLGDDLEGADAVLAVMRKRIEALEAFHGGALTPVAGYLRRDAVLALLGGESDG